MRIDIIHMRDPDSSCDVEVYVDGQLVGGDVVEFWDFDPGAGYPMDEFDENKRAAVETAPESLKGRIAAIYDEMRPSYQKWSYE